MRYLATTSDIRAADASAAARVGVDQLIERAAFAVATTCADLLDHVYGSRVVVLAGSGHNGADALRAGQLLASRGAAVVVVRSSEREGDAFWSAGARGLRVVGSIPSRADLVIDGMVGVGRSGALRGGAAGLASALGGALGGAVGGATVVAVDLPSGVSADTGAADGAAVRADVTVTFERLKPGLVLGRGASLAGQVVIAPVGLDVPAVLPLAMLDADDVAALMGPPSPGADKYSRGVVGIVAGSAPYPGAAVLCAG